MRFTNSELEMIYQYAAPTKAETIGGMKETVPVIKDLLTRVIMENAIEKLQKIPEPECSQFITDNKARFLAGHENSIRRRLAEAKAQQPVMQGHDLTGMERFHPETRHMIVLDVKTSDSPVGFPGERHRYFLSDEGYRNAKASEGRGEIKIKSHAAVAAGKLYRTGSRKGSVEGMGAKIPKMDYRQYRAACRLVHECCNYDNGNCILLDNGEPCVCVQSISYSLLCRWFIAAVLPLDGKLEAALLHRADRKRCTECGGYFLPKSNRGKYCPDCAARVRRRKEADRQRKRYHLSTHLGYERSP